MPGELTCPPRKWDCPPRVAGRDNAARDDGFRNCASAFAVRKGACAACKSARAARKSARAACKSARAGRNSARAARNSARAARNSARAGRNSARAARNSARAARNSARAARNSARAARNSACAGRRSVPKFNDAKDLGIKPPETNKESNGLTSQDQAFPSCRKGTAGQVSMAPGGGRTSRSSRSTPDRSARITNVTRPCPEHQNW